MKVSRNIAITMVCIILGIMLAWQFRSVNYNVSLASLQNKRTEELKEELINLQRANSDLRVRLQELKEENMALEQARAGGDESAKLLQQALEKARIFGGLVAVKGKGLIITIDNNEFATVQDEDIYSVVNELRAAGAQAISVNEERIVAMTEIRNAGRYIMINGVQMEAPFVIKAISDPENLERSLSIIDGVLDTLRDWQLKVTLKQANEIIIPAVREDVIKTDMLKTVEPANTSK